MSGNKYAGWAARGGGKRSLAEIADRPEPEPAPAAQIIIPSRNPPQLHVQPQPARIVVPGARAPAPAPVILMIQQPGTAPLARAPQTRTTMLVNRAERDPYGELLDQLPDLAKAAGIDYAQGVDAMKLPGRPEGAAMSTWSPTARYYNGVTDAQATRQLDEHVGGRYSDSVTSIRGSSATVKPIAGPMTTLPE